MLQAKDTNEAYRLIAEARELLGRAHDKVVAATEERGEHNPLLIGICPRINDMIEILHEAAGVAGKMPLADH